MRLRPASNQVEGKLISDLLVWLNALMPSCLWRRVVAAGTEIGPGGRGRGRLFTPLYCHHQNDSCTLMGSDQRYFNVSLIVRAKSQDSVHRPQESRAAESNRGPSARYCPTLRPYRWATPVHTNQRMRLGLLHKSR